jgi:thiol-disulfide isomerase/thioredoxin
MTARIVLVLLCLSLVVAAANAQTAQATQTTPTTPAAAGGEAKPPERPARETPPDMKALNDAEKITDPAKRIEALEKLKKDFPDSTAASMTDNLILNTLATKMPEQTAKIRQVANTIFRTATAKDKEGAKGIAYTTRRSSAAANLADSLLSGAVLLKDAESWSKKSIDLMKLPMYLAEQREAYAKRKQNLPKEEELARRFQTQRAARVATLGRIELKLGKTAEAKKLLGEAYAVNKDNVNVISALGEIAAKQGDSAQALDYLMSAKLSGRITESANAAFETAFRSQHNGSLDGMDAALDAEYNRRFPNPVHPEAYKPTEKRTDREVLAEIFTGSGCPPCVAADLAFDAALQRYARKDLAVVMFHQHIPQPDPMTNPDTQARAKSYSVSGVPTYVIDGNKTVGGGSRENTKNKFESIQKEIEKDLETPAEARIKVDASLAGDTVKVAANVSGVTSESQDLKVQILLVEKELRYTGENGIRFHPMVVRAIGGEKAGGYPLAESSHEGSFDASFELAAVSAALEKHLDEYEAGGHRGRSFKFTEKKYQINRGDLAVVVFVQDDKTKHVLQAAYVDLGGPAGTRSTSEASGSGNQHR